MNRPLNRVAAVLGWIVLVSGAAGVVASLTNTIPGAGWRPVWFMFGFESVVLASGVISVMLGRGRFGAAPLGLTCVAGTVLVASVFGFLGAGRQVWGVGLEPVLIGRVVLALALGAVAGAVRLEDHPGGTGLLIRGVILAAPALAIPIVAYAMRASIASWPALLSISLAMVAFVAVVGFIAASLDCLIRAFSGPNAAA
ncbi:MAG: hypothetical protein AB7G11_09005 [Phycisphaerales bacterium]